MNTDQITQKLSYSFVVHDEVAIVGVVIAAAARTIFLGLLLLPCTR